MPVSGIPGWIRRLVYGVPSDSAKRAQVVRDEIIAAVEEESYSWSAVRASAKAAYEDLQAGELPRRDDEIQGLIRDICEQYQRKGFKIEDLQKGVDTVQARAAAKLR